MRLLHCGISARLRTGLGPSAGFNCRLRVLPLCPNRRNLSQSDRHGRVVPCRAPHSVTSSTRRSSASGIVSPSALAVFRLIRRSKLVSRSTGKSAGLVAFRILLIGRALVRYASGRLVPNDVNPRAMITHAYQKIAGKCALAARVAISAR